MQTNNAVCFFSSTEALGQTLLCIDSFHKIHGHNSIDYWLLNCSPDSLNSDTDLPAFVKPVNCFDCHLFYSSQIERFGYIGGFSRVLITEYLLRNGYSKVICLDGDMEAFDTLNYIYDSLDHYDLIVTPHILKPLPRDGYRLQLEDICFGGNYNSAFFACSNRKPAIEFINWWLIESLVHGELNFSLCRFAEQGWLRFAGDFVDKIWINREPGLNFAYWRYDGKNFTFDGNRWLVDGQPLKLFHYSGLMPDNLSAISKWQNRYQADPVLLRFLQEYQLRLNISNKMITNSR
jgi:hypothetical protein